MTGQAPPSQSEPAAAPTRPLHEVWSIAWPTILTMTSYTIMQFVDKLMVGQVGPLELTAQSNGGIWSFVPAAWLMGVLSVINTYVAQNLGAGRPERGARYPWNGIWMAVAAWLFFLLPMAACMPWVFALMKTHTPELQRLENGYCQILLIGSVILLSTRSMNHYFFGMHKPKVVTVSTVCGNITNILCNYVLIFGHHGIPHWGLPGVPGMPPLGVYGAAIGTVIGTAVELIIPMAVFLSPKYNGRYRTRAAWRPQRKAIREIVRIGWPTGVQWGNEIICWAVFMTVTVGLFGEQHMTAGWIALGYMHLSFMPAVGVSVATNSLVGKYIGAGRPDIAVARARLSLALAMAYMTACALVFFFGRHPLVALFIGGQDIGPEAAEEIILIGGRLMICAAIFQTFDALGIVYTGGLRGAGDTFWPSVATIAYSWLFLVAGGWTLARFVPQLESIGPWIGAAAFIIFYGLTMAWRFESGAWRSIRLLQPAASGEEAAENAAIGPTPPSSIPEAAIRDLAERAAAKATPTDR